MKSFKFKINGNQYEVDIQSAENNLMQVEVNGSSYQIELEKAIIQNKTPKLVRTTAVPSTDSTPATAKTANPSASKGSGTIKITASRCNFKYSHSSRRYRQNGSKTYYT